MDFCHKPLPIIVVHSSQPRRWWLLTMTTGAQCGVWNQPQMPKLTSDKQNQAKYMDFCHKPLPIIVVQSPQPRRWWLLTMTTGAQCGVWNQHTMLELMSDKQNYPPYMDFCHKSLPIVAVQGPQLRRFSIKVKVSTNFDFGSKFSKNFDFFENFDYGQIIESVRFGSKYSPNFDFFENFEKFRF